MIQIGFSTTDRFISRVIRFVTRSKVSHVFLSVDVPLFGGACALEAGDVGLTLVSLREFNRKNTTVHLFPAVVDLAPALAQLAPLLGSQYDHRGLFGMAFVYLGRLLKARWRNPFRSSDVVFCSEFVVRVMRAAAWPGVDTLDADSVSPSDLLDFLKGQQP